MTTIQGGGGSLYPMDKTSSPITKIQETTPEQPTTCSVPGKEKKEIPIPTLTGIEEQLDKSFKEFKGSLKDAKEKSIIVSGTITGDEAGSGVGMLKSGLNIPKIDYLTPSPDVKMEGKDISSIMSMTISNKNQ